MFELRRLHNGGHVIVIATYETEAAALEAQRIQEQLNSWMTPAPIFAVVRQEI